MFLRLFLVSDYRLRINLPQTGKMLVVFINYENSVLGIMCEAPDPLFDENEDMFKKIVTSYRRATDM